MTRLDRRCWLEDGVHGGAAVGSDAAREAIARVGRRNNGNKWVDGFQPHPPAPMPDDGEDEAWIQCCVCRERFWRPHGRRRYCSDVCEADAKASRIARRVA